MPGYIAHLDGTPNESKLGRKMTSIPKRNSPNRALPDEAWAETQDFSTTTAACIVANAFNFYFPTTDPSFDHQARWQCLARNVHPYGNSDYPSAVFTSSSTNVFIIMDSHSPAIAEAPRKACLVRAESESELEE